MSLTPIALTSKSMTMVHSSKAIYYSFYRIVSKAVRADKMANILHHLATIDVSIWLCLTICLLLIICLISMNNKLNNLKYFYWNFFAVLLLQGITIYRKIMQ